MSVIEGLMRNRMLTAKRRALCDIADNLTHLERIDVAGQLACPVESYFTGVCHVIANLPKEAP